MKRRAAISAIVTAAVSVLWAGFDAQQLSAQTQRLSGARRVLFVYLSRTNNTKAIAEFIHRRVGGTIVQLELNTPYPADYDATVQQVARENETGYLPSLKTRIDRIEDYDVVFLGFPTWGMQLPPPIKSFLRQHSLKGKTVVPFNTNAGYGEGSSFRVVRELCTESTVMDGFVIRGGIERDRQYFVFEGARAEEAEKRVDRWLRTTIAALDRKSP